MSPESCFGYSRFLEWLRWADEKWENNIQAGQKWWAEKIGVCRRTIKRYYAQARKDGIIETLRRWRRTSVITVFGGRHDKQIRLDFGSEPVVIEDQQLTEGCPHSVP